jgi:hypothetical protein
LRNAHFEGKVVAIARYEDEVQPLLDNGVDQVFNFFTDAGLGFAEESLAILEHGNLQESEEAALERELKIRNAN